MVELLRIGTWGVPASAIKSLSQWGWNVDYGRGTRVDLAQWLQKRIPIIAFVRTGFLESGHWQIRIFGTRTQTNAEKR